MLLLSIATVLTIRNADAEDRVSIRVPTQSVLLPLRGMVVDYTGETLTLRTGPMADVRKIPTADVVTVETDYQEAHSRGRDLFAAGKIHEAEEQFQLALEEEERPWVRRELLAALVRCALFEDDLRRAALRFLPIVESDPRTMYWGLIPLSWGVDAVRLPTEAEARTLQVIGTPVAKLIATSWNLERNGRRHAESEAALLTLASDADPTLQRLAQMQLWRVRLSTNTVTPNELRRWEAFAEDLPEALRTGAHVLIGRGAMQQKDALRAAAEWMWLPLQHGEHRGLAAWGQVRAAEAMQAAGDSVAAGFLARETIHRFPAKQAAKQAEVLLNSGADDQPRVLVPRQ
ncbi:MAG: hypothetical protein Q8K78_17320 [Planctomycetaceae bacterium]|nr:hypothetical protein [Planctomycetaceae bacterium]